MLTQLCRPVSMCCSCVSKWALNPRGGLLFGCRWYFGFVAYHRKGRSHILPKETLLCVRVKLSVRNNNQNCRQQPFSMLLVCACLIFDGVLFWVFFILLCSQLHCGLLSCSSQLLNQSPFNLLTVSSPWGLHAVGFLVDCSKKTKCMRILKIPLSLYVAKKQTKKINAGP